MPLIGTEQENKPLANSNYGYSGARLSSLNATEFTLAGIIVDISGSTAGFITEMTTAVKSIVGACQSSPRAGNLMIRLTKFDDVVDEVHGFKELSNVNADDYNNVLRAGGSTALYDATMNGVEAVVDYGGSLFDADMDVNGIVFVITDGADNRSKYNPEAIKKAIEKARQSEKLESILTILIGVNVNDYGTKQYLADFNTKAGFDQYIEISNADSKQLAKLAQFVSKSISAQSQSLGTGGPSKSLSF